MSECDCGHPNCRDCDPLANMTYCYSCHEYVDRNNGCQHEIKKHIHDLETSIKNRQKDLVEYRKLLK